VLETHPSFPAKTVPELIAAAKSNPGKFSLATPTKGTGPYMAAELFKMMAGVDMVLIPYRGEAQMVTDLLGGQVQVAFAGISSSLEHIKGGSLRALAVTTAARPEMFPDVPTVGEYVQGYEASGWCGLVAPKGTPAEIIGRLNSEINAGLADAKFKAALGAMGLSVFPGSSAAFGALIADETEKWGRVVKFAGLKPD